MKRHSFLKVCCVWCHHGAFYLTGSRPKYAWHASYDTRIDYYKMLRIVKESGCSGYIGIEYEGEWWSKHADILANGALIKKVWQRI